MKTDHHTFKQLKNMLQDYTAWHTLKLVLLLGLVLNRVPQALRKLVNVMFKYVRLCN
jgi:hypothetical protein